MNPIEGLLASLLNPNPGMQRAGLLGPNAMAQTGLGPEQLARYHQMSGMGGGAPQAAPSAGVNPINNRPILDNGDGSYSTEESITVTDPRLNGGRPTNIPSIWGGRRTGNEDEAVGEALRSGQQFSAFNSIPEAVTAAKARSRSLDAGVPGGARAPSGGGIGDMLGNLFMPKTAQKNRTVQLLMQEGLDEGTATLYAGNKQALNQYLLLKSQGQKPIEINGRLVDPNTYQVLADFSEKKDPSLVNAGDGNLYDPQSGQWITAPNAGQKPPQVVELFDEATGQPYKATWNPEKRDYERVGGVKARTGMQLTTNPDGTVTLTEGSISGMPKLTEAEGRNAGFYGRSVESHKLLSDLEKEGTSLWNKAAGGVPVVGNYALGADAQKFQQAQRDFINAVLRRESGAVISPEEFDNAKQQYFPQPGDGPEVIDQKRRNRDTTILGLKISGGQGSQFAIPGEPDPERFGGKSDRPQKRLKFNPATGELE